MLLLLVLPLAVTFWLLAMADSSLVQVLAAVAP